MYPCISVIIALLYAKFTCSCGMTNMLKNGVNIQINLIKWCQHTNQPDKMV